MVENDAIRPRDGLLAMQAPDGSYTGECGRMTIHSHPDLTGRRAWLCSAPAVTLLLLLLAACAAPIRLNAVPEERTTDAGIPGIPGARFWVDNESEPFVREALQSFETEKAYLAGTGHTGALPPVSFLAVSGGGDHEAFGAGILKGWPEHGDRRSKDAGAGKDGVMTGGTRVVQNN